MDTAAFKLGEIHSNDEMTFEPKPGKNADITSALLIFSSFFFLFLIFFL